MRPPITLLCPLRRFGRSFSNSFSPLTSDYYFIVSILLITFSSAVIYTADMGVSTYDWIALKTAEVQKKVSFKWCRVGTDLVCVIIGLIFSIIPGIGTIVTAFLLGPLVSFFRTYCSEPFLYGKNKVAWCYYRECSGYLITIWRKMMRDSRGSRLLLLQQTINTTIRLSNILFWEICLYYWYTINW